MNSEKESPMGDELPADLSKLSFFGEFPAETLKQMTPFASLRAYAPGDVVFREGQVGKEVFVVRKGRAAVEICAPGMGCRRLLVAGPGELLGWSPLIDRDGILTATARATEPLELVAIDAEQLRRLFAEQPEIGYQTMQEIAKALAKRLAATRMQLLDLYANVQSPPSPTTQPSGD